jgi:hypothetical protein
MNRWLRKRGLRKQCVSGLSRRENQHIATTRPTHRPHGSYFNETIHAVVVGSQSVLGVPRQSSRNLHLSRLIRLVIFQSQHHSLTSQPLKQRLGRRDLFVVSQG